MYRVRLTPFLLFLLLFALPSSANQSLPQISVRIDSGPSRETISTWETRSQSDPDNLQLRGALLAYYTAHGPQDKCFQQALWVVQHHPESSYAAITASAGAAWAGPDYALLKSAWEQSVIDQADSGKVLYHAGMFFARQDPVRAVHLFEQARQLETENQEILRAEGGLYAMAFPSEWPFRKRSDAQTLEAEVAAITDPALLAEIGTDCVRLGTTRRDSSLKAKGTELINRAISLDPANPKWKTAAERATLAPPPPPAPAPAANGGPGGAVHIGAKVAEANLIRKVDPVYPATAVPARISGVVEFTALIGENGQIQNLELVRGHPLFVNAAREAVLQYVYRPTLLNGNPVPVVTSIMVPFESPQQ
jgi:hypothetical protein